MEIFQNFLCVFILNTQVPYSTRIRKTLEAILGTTDKPHLLSLKNTKKKIRKKGKKAKAAFLNIL